MESLGSTNDMLNVQKAINIIVSKATSLQEETILLKNSLGRICSKNIYSNINSPPENVSSMDGYALKYSNIKNINKIPIKIVGESAAGNPYIKKLNNYWININDINLVYTTFLYLKFYGYTWKQWWGICYFIYKYPYLKRKAQLFGF